MAAAKGKAVFDPMYCGRGIRSGFISASLTEREEFHARSTKTDGDVAKSVVVVGLMKRSRQCHFYLGTARKVD
jgi:hypothetical protein